LTQELESQGKFLSQDVVEKTHEKYRERSGQKTHELRSHAVSFGKGVRDLRQQRAHLRQRRERRGESYADEHGDGEGHEERDSPEPGNRHPVLFPSARMIEPASGHTDPAHEGQ
jgi:hypothetical protein